MTPKESVLGGYASFAEGDMECLAKIYHEDASIKVNGNHELSGQYHGFHDFLRILYLTYLLNFQTSDLKY